PSVAASPPPASNPSARKEATVPLPQAGAKASVLVPAQKRTTGDRDVPVPSDAAPTAHASPEEVARAQQLAAVRSGIMAALPHRKSMRHELGQKRRGTVTMRGGERRSNSSDKNESVDEGMGKPTPSRAAMGALAPPPGTPAQGIRESQSFTSPHADPLEAGASDPGDAKMTEALPVPPVRRRRTPANPAVSADTEANDPRDRDDDDEEGGSTASILPGQLASLAPRRQTQPPPTRSRHPLVVVGISFAVVLALGIILLLIVRSRGAPAAAPPPPPAGEAPQAPPPQELAAATPPAPLGGGRSAWVRFDAPPGTIIQHGDQRFAAGLSFPIQPGPFAIDYRCPGHSAPVSAVVQVQDGRSDTQVVP